MKSRSKKQPAPATSPQIEESSSQPTTVTRLLSKSRFKLGCECPTKLYYDGNKEYGNNKEDNKFLKALAEGGFQVGELAKFYYPGGKEIETLHKLQALTYTNLEFKRDPEATIYEAAVQFGQLFVRVDILKKSGNTIDLIEVKSKSFDSSEGNPFFNARADRDGNPVISSSWLPYLRDIAFQTYVVQKAYPDYKVRAFLMLADTSAKATVDGLNQKFFLKKDNNGRNRVEVAQGLRPEDLGDRILKAIPVDDAVAVVFKNKFPGERGFTEYIEYLSRHYAATERPEPVVSKSCKGCEFRIDDAQKAAGLKSGFEECWKAAQGLKDKDFKRPMVFDIWNFRRSAQLIERKLFFMDQLKEDDIGSNTSEKPGLSNNERQWIQVCKATKGDVTPYLDKAGLAAEMASWKFPLHFIDFETMMAAIPFNKGRRPYEQTAFQFSHHVIEADGRIEHRTEYLFTERGRFPNFDFVRNLMKALSNDEGTIFRYADHENTVLCQILEQIDESPEPVKDAEELKRFIRSITKSKQNADEEWRGERCMVDLKDLVVRYFYHPFTEGSNSIKAVLPAILKDSEFLQKKYSQPIYGAEGGIPSKNFKNHCWLQPDGKGGVKDPYKILEPVFSDLTLDQMDAMITEDTLADGGAAMTAYARMQFTQMSDEEVARVRKALLRYCELDTFAMVMLYEYWKNLLT